MKTKDSSVQIDLLHESMRQVMIAADYIWTKYGEECVITAGREAVDSTGKLIHSPRSLHPYGKALDFRTRYFTEDIKQKVGNDLRASLGVDYDVILHSSHIHVEFDSE